MAGGGIERFRKYSEKVWEFAIGHSQYVEREMDVAFATNMAQNMYKWARMSQEAGASATLYLDPQDYTVISQPAWEEFDGEYTDLFDAAGFLHSCTYGVPDVSVRTPKNEGSILFSAYYDHPSYGQRHLSMRDKISKISSVLAEKIYPTSVANFKTDAIDQLKQEAPSVNHALLLGYPGHYPYYEWAKSLASHDVIYIAANPFPALVSGKPFCACPVGGDLQVFCGRNTSAGRATLRGFRSAYFMFVSNPHMLGHCRRLGLTNAVYLPYPMDTERYTPGKGNARSAWQQQYGGDFFVLVTSRIDAGVKGFGPAVLEELRSISAARAGIRFIVMGWGADLELFRNAVSAAGLKDKVIIIAPVGKRRLIDYYRSCDVVLDQLIWGYYGATALEAAACGKPVIMKLQSDQYSDLYMGDCAPVCQVSDIKELRSTLMRLVDCPDECRQSGEAMRSWLVRNHGQQRTTRLMLALIQLAADGVQLPKSFKTPLSEPLSTSERLYHLRCHIAGVAAAA